MLTCEVHALWCCQACRSLRSLVCLFDLLKPVGAICGCPGGQTFLAQTTAFPSNRHASTDSLDVTMQSAPRDHVTKACRQTLLNTVDCCSIRCYFATFDQNKQQRKAGACRPGIERPVAMTHHSLIKTMCAGNMAQPRALKDPSKQSKYMEPDPGAQGRAAPVLVQCTKKP